MTTFWNTSASAPPVPVLQPTAGDALNTPVQLLPGSSGVSLADPQIWRDAQTLFPVFDGETNVLPQKPASFSSPSGSDFVSWHSAHQLQYLREHGTETSVTDGGTTYQRIQANLSHGVVAIMGQDGRSVIRVDTLDQVRIARLSYADQLAVAGMSEFRTNYATVNGLSPSGTQSVSEAREALKSLTKALSDDILAQNPTTLPADRNTFLSDPSSRGRLAHLLFVEQLGLLDAQLDKTAIFAADVIGQDIQEIQERYERFQRYSSFAAESPAYNAASPVPSNPATLTSNITALDGGASISAGRDIFLRTETQVYESILARSYIAATGRFADVNAILQNGFDSASGNYLGYNEMFENAAAENVTNTTADFVPSYGRLLDGPTSIFIIQNLRSIAREAEAEAKSEELNQSNQLLRDYSQMQQIINQTLNGFKADTGGDDPEETRTVLGVSHVRDLTSASITEDNPNAYRAISMFDTLGIRNATLHPNEQVKNVTRPSINFDGSGSWDGALESHTKTVYDSMAISLGEATRLLTQDNQIKTQEINSVQKSKNRTFDFGTNVLSKMTSLLRSIVS